MDFMQTMSSETAIFKLTSEGNSYQNEATTKKSSVFKDKQSVQHSKNGGWVERVGTRSHYKKTKQNKKNQPPSYVFLADHNN